MAEYVASESGSLERLRNKVSGLSSKVLDDLIAEAQETESSHTGSYTRKRYRGAEEALEPETVQVLTELGRAVRYLRGCVAESDIRRDWRENCGRASDERPSV